MYNNMNNMYRTRAILLFLITLFLIFVGYFLLLPEYFNAWWLCEGAYVSGGELECFSKYGLSVGKPFFRALPYVAATFLLLAFIPYAYPHWRKFGYWTLPFFVLLVSITPVFGQSFAPVPQRTDLAIFLGQLFFLISAIIIAHSWWKQRKTQ